MAKKKKKKTIRKPPKPGKRRVLAPPPAQPQCKFDNQMLDSDFLKKLYEQFFNAQSQPTWPAGDDQKARNRNALQQIPEAFTALLAQQINQEQLAQPQAQGPDPTALFLVNKAAADTGWPGASSKIPANRQLTAASYRLFEVAWAVNIMVQAYTRKGGGGGGPDDWPSGGHHP